MFPSASSRPADATQYTSYWNLANYPAGVFPTGLHVDASDSKDKQDIPTPRNPQEKEIYSTYDPDVAVGAPLCLQVVGYVGHEEETLDAMQKIVDAVTK